MLYPVAIAGEVFDAELALIRAESRWLIFLLGLSASHSQRVASFDYFCKSIMATRKLSCILNNYIGFDDTSVSSFWCIDIGCQKTAVFS